MEGELAAEVDAIIKARWELRDGEVVPETNDITLGNSGVKLDATVLYADLADSTELALFDREIVLSLLMRNEPAPVINASASSWNTTLNSGATPNLVFEPSRPTGSILFLRMPR